MQTTDYASVILVPSKLILLPDQSAKVVVTITPPKTGDKSTFPIYSGIIQATGSLGENVHTSYLGLNAKTSDLVVIDNTDYYFGVNIPAIIDSFGNFQTPGTNYTLSGPDAPSMLYRLAAGSPAVYFDLVSANTTFKPTDLATRRRAIPRRRLGDFIEARSNSHPAERTVSENAGAFERSYWFPGNLGPLSGKNGGTFTKVPTIGPIGAYQYQVRSTDDIRKPTSRAQRLQCAVAYLPFSTSGEQWLLLVGV